MGWRDFLQPPDLVEKKEKKEKTPAEIEKIPFTPFIPPGGDSESPDLTIIDHLTAPAKPVEGGIEFVSLLTDTEREQYFSLLESMEEGEAGAIIARIHNRTYRQPLQIQQALQDYRRYGYVKIFSTVLNRAVYLAKHEQAAKRVPDRDIPVYTESDIEAVKGLDPEVAKVLLEARILFGGSIKKGHD